MSVHESLGITAGFTEKTYKALEDISKDVENKALLEKQSLDKDAFLKILTTQLANQNPMKPMNDTEFIGQMAQFSSVEQLSTIATSMEHNNTKTDELKLLISEMNENISQLNSNSSEYENMTQKQEELKEISNKILEELEELNDNLTNQASETNSAVE